MKFQTSLTFIFILICVKGNKGLEKTNPLNKNVILPNCEYDMNKISLLITEIEGQKEFAKGGFGALYKLNDGTVLKKVVIYPKETTEIKNELKMFKLFEDDINLSHLRECYYFLSETGKINIFMIMDFYTTGDLFQLVGSEIFKSIIWKFDVMYKIAESLRIMHSKGIAHLDIKMENLFMMNFYNPILGDFGMSLDVGHNETRDFPCGTDPYRAREAISNFNYTLKTDIYALGILFYEIINNQILHVQPDMEVSSFSNEMFAIYHPLIKKMLRKNNRPDIDTVIEYLLKNFYKINDLLKAHASLKDKGLQYLPFEKYLIYERNAIKKETVDNLVVFNNKVKLLEMQKSRADIYKKYAEKPEKEEEEEESKEVEPSEEQPSVNVPQISQIQDSSQKIPISQIQDTFQTISISQNSDTSQNISISQNSDTSQNFKNNVIVNGQFVKPEIFFNSEDNNSESSDNNSESSDISFSKSNSIENSKFQVFLPNNHLKAKSLIGKNHEDSIDIPKKRTSLINISNPLNDEKKEVDEEFENRPTVVTKNIFNLEEESEKLEKSLNDPLPQKTNINSEKNKKKEISKKTTEKIPPSSSKKESIYQVQKVVKVKKMEILTNKGIDMKKYNEQVRVQNSKQNNKGKDFFKKGDNALNKLIGKKLLI